ncbi:DUF2187 domain-containing protein, partial [Bacillus cereus]|uniref:DUF2187 domain-containing protein n=1 Tax=Bacillus cereus TaxID=1396 RepID=UPI000BF3C89E
MEKINLVLNINKGDYVQFSYRKDPSLKLSGYVVTILTNTIIVDISQMVQLQKYQDLDVYQVVKHGCYIIDTP